MLKCLHLYCIVGSGLFEIDSNGNDVMLKNGVSVLEPVGSDRIFICLSSNNTVDAVSWYFPNGSVITNILQFSDDAQPGIAVFHALPEIGVYQLRMNGYFTEVDSGRYECRSNNDDINTQSVYIYTETIGTCSYIN